MKSFIIFLLIVPLFCDAQPAQPDLTLTLGVPEVVKSKYNTLDEIPMQNGTKRRLVEGDIVYFPVEIKNVGQAASGKFTVELRADRTDYDLQRNNSGKSHKIQTFKQTFNSIAPGQNVVYKPEAVIDCKNGEYSNSARITYMEKEDWNNGNNSDASGTYLVWSRKWADDYVKPDLEVKISSPDASRHIQRTVKMMVEVRNTGKSNARPTTVDLKCKGKNTKTKRVPALKPNETFRCEFQHKWSTVGTRTCTAIADPKNVVKEKNEENNSADLRVRIKL